jgi:hypothetical protein
MLAWLPGGMWQIVIFDPDFGTLPRRTALASAENAEKHKHIKRGVTIMFLKFNMTFSLTVIGNDICVAVGRGWAGQAIIIKKKQLTPVNILFSKFPVKKYLT